MALTRTNQKEFRILEFKFCTCRGNPARFYSVFLSPYALNYQGLRKAESSLAIQLHREKMGLAAFHAHRVPDSVSLTLDVSVRLATRGSQKRFDLLLESRPLPPGITRSRRDGPVPKQFVDWIAHVVVAGWAMNKGLLEHFRLQRSR